MKNSLLILRIIIIIYLSASKISANTYMPLFYEIESNLKRYRQTISQKDFYFNNGIVHIEINSRRTTINSQVLIGFISVGRSLQRLDVISSDVEIIINYETKINNTIRFRSKSEDVIKFSKGMIGPDQFINKFVY